MTFKYNYVKAFDNTEVNSELSRANDDFLGLTKEQLLLNDVQSLAQEYIELEQHKRKYAQILLENLDELDFTEFINYPKYLIKESFLKKKVESANIRGLNVICVDGSSVVKRFMDVDFSFLKAIAVKYYFNKNHDAQIQYYPDLNGFNNYSIQGNFLNREEQITDIKSSIDMNYMEINLLNRLIRKYDDIDFIIIDGSVVIMPIHLLFSKEDAVSIRYDKLLQEYHKLYNMCKEKNIVLIGSIKDTRSSALTHLLKDSILYLKPTSTHLNEFLEINYRQLANYFSDLDLFNRVLKKSERTCMFCCKREVDKIRDTGIKSEIPYYFPVTFYAFYLKTTLFDSPCRIEFFIDERHSFAEASKKADLIASTLLPISSLNEYYGLPIPQIEAHKRAVFNSVDIDLLFNNLARTLSKNGVNLMEKRRNRRPF